MRGGRGWREGGGESVVDGNRLLSRLFLVFVFVLVSSLGECLYVVYLFSRT